jgi:hypothetical protein
MGNAYLTSFFVGGAWDHTKLHHSVKAYQNAVSWHFILFGCLWLNLSTRVAYNLLFVDFCHFSVHHFYYLSYIYFMCRRRIKL